MAGEVLYYRRNDTVILECDKLSNTTIMWKGHANDLVYAIGRKISPNLSVSKKERLSIIHDEAKQFDLKIERFSLEDEGNYRCVRYGISTTIKVKTFHLKMARIPSNLSVDREDIKHTVYGFLNHPLNLTCKVIHGIPEGTLQWRINNKTVNEGKTPLTYKIRDLQMSDHMKNYTCVVSNNFTKYILEHTVHLFVYSKYGNGQVLFYNAMNKFK
ncbi:HMCN [Mytilus coruscus]|uniref:HMCN n=1 Tax=Mytilus coruscus TaxID=42192 RepID=A0A6J7ZTC9_MYTCO|nr:HMCN [Mytilus coruscus]